MGRVRRVLRLLRLLEQERGLAELQAELEVGAVQLWRDVALLRGEGYVIEESTDPGRGRAKVLWLRPADGTPPAR